MIHDTGLSKHMRRTILSYTSPMVVLNILASPERLARLMHDLEIRLEIAD